MQPKVLALMLTADRPQFIRRAIKCFREQSYESKALLVYDTGIIETEIVQGDGVYAEWFPEENGLTIGALRNRALQYSNPMCLNADIIVHFDVDDWSAPTRIAEQVEMLIQSQAAAVGYNEMLFLETFPHYGAPEGAQREPRAWRYTNRDPHYCLGTSLCYWRKTWEAKPFADTSAGEDLQFCEGLVTAACSAIRRGKIQPLDITAGVAYPLMIAEVHGGNTHHKRIDPQLSERENMRQWHRAPEWDERIREIMKL